MQQVCRQVSGRPAVFFMAWLVGAMHRTLRHEYVSVRWLTERAEATAMHCLYSPIMTNH